MFHRDRWAEAFFAVSGGNADAVFLCLKALVPPVKSIHGALFGYGASVKLEKILRESSLQRSAFQGNAFQRNETSTDPAAEYAIRFICLLVERNCFRYIDTLLEKIEQTLNERKGILDVTLESAAPMDSVQSAHFEEELTKMIKEKTGATGIKMKTHIKPELLGGYLLRFAGFYIDASLKGQLNSITAELTQAAKMIPGGNNG